MCHQHEQQWEILAVKTPAFFGMKKNMTRSYHHTIPNRQIQIFTSVANIFSPPTFPAMQYILNWLNTVRTTGQRMGMRIATKNYATGTKNGNRDSDQKTIHSKLNMC